jgi:NADP-dependent 3-hydroxy acid dehydrogenase YdfG
MVFGIDHTELVKPDDVDTMIDTNIRGPLNLVRAILPGMRERQEGHIINVGSIAGIEAYSGGSVYCATKHALNAITQVLRHELMDTPIRVSEIKPGKLLIYY